jgi:PAS domain S-box-containing protein
VANLHSAIVRSFSQFGAALVALAGAAVLVGWLFEIAALKSVLPGLVTMKANTALALLLAGLALLSLDQATTIWRLVSRVLSIGVIVLGAAALAEYALSADFGIDELLARDEVRFPPYPGRMAPATAAAVTFAGVALFNLKGGLRRRRYAIWCAVPVLALGWLGVTGYAYDVEGLYGVGPYASMAVHTAAGLVVLGLAILATESEAGLVGIAVTDTAGGALARRVIPAIPIVFLLLGMGWLAGDRAGLYGGSFGVSLMVLAATAVSVVTLAWHASLLHAADLARRKAEANALALTASLAEKKFEALLEAAPDGMVIVNQAGTITLVNAQIERLFGYTRDELLGRPVELLVPDRVRADHMAHRADFSRQARSRPMGASLSLYARRKDGSEFPVEVSLSPLQTDEGLLVSSAVRDVTDRRRVEDALRESNERFRVASEAAEVGYWDWDVATNKVVWSDTYRLLYGMPADAPASYEGWIATVHPEDRAYAVEMLRAAIESRQPFRVEYRIQHSLRGLRWLAGRGEAAYDAAGRPVRVSGVNIDITDRKEAEQTIRASLEEKETLLREVHHRVKNNLAVISSLFYLESTYAKESESVRLFQEARDRVLSMAMVHETLYRSANLARLDFGAYLETLLQHLLRTYAAVQPKIAVHTAIEAVSMSIDTAIPCALIVNELVTNSLKHAFPGDRTGEIRVGLRSADGRYILSVVDTGVGIPSEVDPATARTLGLRLVRSLTTQIGGEFRIQRTSPGSEASLSFPEEERRPEP